MQRLSGTIPLATFAARRMLPVNAFGSVTMYDGKTQLLIKHPINGYPVNTAMASGMKKCGRFRDDLHPEGFAGQGQGRQLAAGAG